MNTAFMNAALLEASTVGSTISGAITAVAVILILLGVLLGMKRGMYKTTLRILTVVASSFIAYWVIEGVTDYLHGLFVGRTLEEIITGVWPGYTTAVAENLRNIINSFDAVTVERIIAAGTVILILPIVFTLVFIVAKLLTTILYFIIRSILRLGGINSPVSSLLGGFLGALQGALITGVILLPIAGLAGMAEEAREPLIADKDPAVAEKITNVYVNYLDDICANSTLKTIRSLGGDAIFSDMTTVTVGDEEVDMQKEAIVLVEIVADGAPLMKDFSWAELRPEDKKAMSAILSDVGDDDYTANTVAGVLRAMSVANRVGAFSFGFEYPFNEFMDEFIQIFADSNRENVEADLETFLNVYFILNDYQVLSHFAGGLSEGSAESLLSQDADGDSVVNKIIDTLSANPRTKGLVTSLTKFSLKLMAESAGNLLPEGMDAEQVYEDVKLGMNDVLEKVNDESITPEEKHEVVKEEINNTLISSGVITEDTPISEEAMDSLTDYVMENYVGKEELTDDDINNAILAYYTKTGKEPGTPINPDDINPDDFLG